MKFIIPTVLSKEKEEEFALASQIFNVTARDETVFFLIADLRYWPRNVEWEIIYNFLKLIL